MKQTKITYGMALSTIGAPNASAGDFADFANFNAVELPPDFFEGNENSAMYKKMKSGVFENIISGGLVDKSLTRSIAFSSSAKMRRAYVLECSKQISFLVEKGISNIALEMPMNDILHNEEAYKNALGIIKGTAKALIDGGVTLHLPFAIPCAEGDTSLMMKFLRDTLLPSVKARIEIHTHLLPQDATPEKLCGTLYFEAASAVFVYDADCGNRITKELAAPWTAFFRAHKHFIPFLVAPLSLRQRAAFPEAETFSKLAPEL